MPTDENAVGGADPLQLDAESTANALCEFLRKELDRRPRHRGYVIGISGGIDSAVTAALCTRAVGKKRALGVLLPERESQPEGVDLARQLVEHLDLPSLQFDISESLAALDVYRGREAVVRRLIGDFQKGWSYRLAFPGDLRESRALNVYRLEVFRPDGTRDSVRPDAESLRQLQALTNVKQRVRMAWLYREAEATGSLVCGTTNRSELALGFFVRYGDGGVDLEPLAGLYKTQVRGLAEYLGLPAAIVRQTPSPDTWSAKVSDQEFYLRMDYAQLDRILARIERGDSSESIAVELAQELEFVRRARAEIERRRAATGRHRELASTLADEGSAHDE